MSPSISDILRALSKTPTRNPTFHLAQYLLITPPVKISPPSFRQQFYNDWPRVLSLSGTKLVKMSHPNLKCPLLSSPLSHVCVMTTVSLTYGWATNRFPLMISPCYHAMSLHIHFKLFVTTNWVTIIYSSPNLAEFSLVLSGLIGSSIVTPSLLVGSYLHTFITTLGSLHRISLDQSPQRPAPVVESFQCAKRLQLIHLSRANLTWVLHWTGKVNPYLIFTGPIFWLSL